MFCTMFGTMCWTMCCTMSCTSGLHSFVGARGQVRPTGVSAGECQGHQQSLTPLSKPQIPLSKPPTPKPHQSSHPLMCFTTRQPKQCKCVSVYQYHHQMYQQLHSNVSDWFWLNPLLSYFDHTSI